MNVELMQTTTGLFILSEVNEEKSTDTTVNLIKPFMIIPQQDGRTGIAPLGSPVIDLNESDFNLSSIMWRKKLSVLDPQEKSHIDAYQKTRSGLLMGNMNEVSN